MTEGSERLERDVGGETSGSLTHISPPYVVCSARGSYARLSSHPASGPSSVTHSVPPFVPLGRACGAMGME